MPHITVIGCDKQRQIKLINIHAEINFAQETFGTPKADRMMDELQEELETVVKKYFNTYSSQQLSNHEWNFYWAPTYEVDDDE